MLRKVLVAAVAAMALAGPAQAAGTTSGYLLGSQALDFRAGLQPTRYAPPNVRFHPDPTLRQAVTRQVMGIVQRKDPALASALGSKPFDSFGPALAAHSISDSNLTDSLAFMMLSLWDAANASDKETTPGQTAAVKRQAENILAVSLGGGTPVAGSVQEASDSIYLSALTVAILSSKVMETRDPAALAQLQEMGSRESMASFGVDFRRLALTERGFVPR